MNKMLYGKSTTGSNSVALFLTALMVLSTSAVLFASNDATPEVLAEENPVVYRSADQQTYELYIDKANDTVGGKGTITTIEPTGGSEK